MRYALFVVLAVFITLAGCSSAGGPDPDRDRWLLPLMFSLLFSAMFKFAEIIYNWWKNRQDHGPPQ